MKRKAKTKDSSDFFLNDSDTLTDLVKLSSTKNKSRQKLTLKKSTSESYLLEQYENEQEEKLSNELVKSASMRDLQARDSSTTTFIKNNNAITVFKTVPRMQMAPLHITNQNEAKKKFLESNIPPMLKFKADSQRVKIMLQAQAKAGYDHFFKAKYILDLIVQKYPKGVFSYYEENFGKKIDANECIHLVGKYLNKNRIDGEIRINFAPGLSCSGRIYHYGMKDNRPETRQFVVWINNDKNNQFIREKGIVCLLDHELGTHYYRAYNDGLQVWFKNRAKYGLRQMQSRQLTATEEGLAALNTLMSANLKYLYLPALLYYLAAMANKMTFEQLFNHMEKYVHSAEERWKLVTRVKRGISNPNQLGCYSRDQCYFDGAIQILEHLDDIDFSLLMSGKICVDELELVKGHARIDKLRVPEFMKSMRAYKRKLRQIGVINGILGPNRVTQDDNDLKEEELKKYIKSQIDEARNMQVNLPRQLDSQSDDNTSSLCILL